jgi:hypothetical protein
VLQLLGFVLVLIGLVFAVGLSTQDYVEGSCGAGNCVFETHSPDFLPLAFGVILIVGGLYLAMRKTPEQRLRKRIEEQQKGQF